MIARALAATPLLLCCCVLVYEVTDSAGTGGMDGSGGAAEAESTDTDVIECGPDETQCGALCVDLLTNPNHCNSCGSACALEEACDGGECRGSCRNGNEICEQQCVDLDADPSHCGDCGVACSPGIECLDGICGGDCDDSCDREREICQQGSCICRSGLVDCGSGCVDTQADPAHCGDCDAPCGGDPCGAGQCQPEGCGAFPDACGDSCTNVGVDPLHCGDCDTICDADEDCVEGQCREP